MPESSLAADLLTWFDRHGRHDLPWQRDATPYRVWVSEVMLQQTRVEKVVAYFQRFMHGLPELADLAAADLDRVLALWSGLGYYARARHLHRAAELVMQRHAGVVPADLAALQALPGIGRSTAGAILSLGCGRPYPILDGNVKRVFARVFAVEGWPGRSAVQRTLWGHAEAQLARRRPGDYNQALMDLGASVCSRRKPDCPACPLKARCQACQDGEPEAYPAPAPRVRMPLKSAQVLLIRDARGRVLLQRRPPAGVWGGLWSLPEAPADADPAPWALENLGLETQFEWAWASFRHTFSHYHYDMRPVVLRLLEPGGGGLRESADWAWRTPHAPPNLGIPAPVSRLLHGLGRHNPGADRNDPNGAVRKTE